MVVHKCDLCGKEMSAWLIVTIDIGAAHDYVNVSDLIGLRGRKEYCNECFGPNCGTDMRAEEAEE